MIPKDNTNPFVSIVTAAYNSSPFILRLYKSLLAQIDNDFEWIIVDDGSSDETEEIILSLPDVGIGGIYYYRLFCNSGGNTATALGVSKSQGQAIAIIDHDDELTDQAIWTIKQFASRIWHDNSLGGVLFPSVESKTGKKITSINKCTNFNYAHFMSKEKTSLDGVFAYKASVAYEMFCNDDYDSTILNGLPLLRVSKSYDFLYSGTAPILYYHRDNSQSQTNNVRVSNKLAYTYSRILDYHQPCYYGDPLRWIRHTLALVQFSWTVYDGPWTPFQWIKRITTRLWYLLWIPLGSLLFFIRPQKRRVIYTIVAWREAAAKAQMLRAPCGADSPS